MKAMKMDGFTFSMNYRKMCYWLWDGSEYDVFKVCLTKYQQSATLDVR